MSSNCFSKFKPISFNFPHCFNSLAIVIVSVFYHVSITCLLGLFDLFEFEFLNTLMKCKRLRRRLIGKIFSGKLSVFGE